MDLSNENVIHVEKEGIQYLQFRKLLKYSDIITHGYSLGIEKNFRTARANKQKLPEQEAKKAIKDYENLGKCIDIKLNKMVKPNQAHTDKIQIVEKHILENEPDFNLEVYDKTDGLITNKKDIALATTNADCILLLFFDPVNKVIANVPSYYANFDIVNAEILKSDDDLRINGSDIFKVLQVAVKSKMKKDREFVTIIPINFTVDDKKNAGQQNLHGNRSPLSF